MTAAPQARAARASPSSVTRPPVRTLAWGLTVATVAAQISYPLLREQALVTATVATVLLFAAASTASAAATHGTRAAVTLLVVAGGVGLLAEAVGVATGVPFGRYAYAGTLGPQVLGVPVVVPLAWAMMAWPTLLAGRALARRLGARRASGGPRAARWLPVPLAAVALAAWDLFLDPQMVAAGHWVWAEPSPALPGVPGIPVTNYAGWLLVALIIQAALHRVVPDGDPRDDRGGEPGTDLGRDGWGPPAVLLAWTWLGSTLANLAFFGRPAVAAWGFAAMGVVVAPYLLGLRRRAR